MIQMLARPFASSQWDQFLLRCLGIFEDLSTHLPDNYQARHRRRSNNKVDVAYSLRKGTLSVPARHVLYLSGFCFCK